MLYCTFEIPVHIKIGIWHAFLPALAFSKNQSLNMAACTCSWHFIFWISFILYLPCKKPRKNRSNCNHKTHAVTTMSMQWLQRSWKLHWMKSVKRRSFFWSVLYTKRKVSEVGVFSGPYFVVFGLNTGLDFRILSKYGKIRTRMNSVFGHFSHSVKETNGSFCF